MNEHWFMQIERSSRSRNLLRFGEEKIPHEHRQIKHSQLRQTKLQALIMHIKNEFRCAKKFEKSFNNDWWVWINNSHKIFLFRSHQYSASVARIFCSFSSHIRSAIDTRKTIQNRNSQYVSSAQPSLFAIHAMRRTNEEIKPQFFNSAPLIYDSIAYPFPISFFAPSTLWFPKYLHHPQKLSCDFKTDIQCGITNRADIHSTHIPVKIINLVYFVGNLR